MFSASKTAVVGGYRIPNSLRFRSSASAYLNRTFTTPTNQKIWTWSGWVKRGSLGSTQEFFFSYAANNDTQYGGIAFESDNTLIFSCYTTYAFQTSAVFRDPSSWYHIVLAVDTTQATATNRMKLYVNGVQYSYTQFGAFPAQNGVLAINQAAAHSISSRQPFSSSLYFDGYLADINFIDGQALTPSSFGAFNATTGVWGPIAYTGTYGTNGFKLNFSNGTSTTTLGYDSSGNGNNWTTNNISLTAGSTYDWMLDSPTPYQGSSYGVGNYCVLNPLANSVYNTVSEANLKVTGSGSWGNTRASFGLTSGKWYWEQSITSGTWGFPGISTAQAVLDTYDYPYTVYGWAYRSDNGNKYTANTQTAYGASFGVGDIIGVAFDADSGSLTFYKNGTSQGVAFTGLTSGPYFPTVAGLSSVNVINFGQRPFAYTPPSGYKSLCTYNLPTPTIQNGSGYMAATLYTGTLLSNAVSNAVNGVSFQPDLVWVKSRSAATDHKLTDSVRGTTKALVSDSTAAETTDSQGLTAFGSSGFTVGTDTTYNNLAATFVGWQWKAGGTAVTNTAGSITSSVSANTTSGFAVVTYTGTGSNATVGHGLGVAPSMIIVKCRGINYEWKVWHTSLAVGNWLVLSNTGAAVYDPTNFTSTLPTSTVFNIGTNVGTNAASTFVAYCFAAIPGYSAFGSYTGNGSADGPFIFTGFRPRYVLYKRSDATADWRVFDTSRDPYNVGNAQLIPNTSLAESNSTTTSGIDILSNGFKLRNSDGYGNASGGTYVYACFAENPFTNALAR